MDFKNLDDVEKYALYLMKIHNVDENVKFEFMKSVGHIGECQYNKQGKPVLIRLSKRYVEANLDNLQFITDTLLHEIAHALAGSGAGHGVEWERKCRELGCVASRRTEQKINQPKRRYKYTCPNCGRVTYYDTRRNKACLACCNMYNNRKYSEKYKFIITENKD